MAPPFKSPLSLPIRPTGGSVNDEGWWRAMQIPGAHVVTLYNPVRYTTAQIDRACVVAHYLQRGRFVLCEAPRR